MAKKFTTFLAVLMTLIAAGGVIAFGASTDWFTNFDKTKENLTPPTTSETTTEDTSNYYSCSYGSYQYYTRWYSALY